MRCVIQNGWVIDPETELDGRHDVVVSDGMIQRVTEPNRANTDSARVIDATDHWVTPGFVDLGASFCEPGFEFKEDLRSGCSAAVAGGYTQVALSPETTPAIDCVELIEFIQGRATRLGLAEIRPIGAATLGLNGQAMAPIAEMVRGGAVAVGDGDHWIRDSALMRRILEYSSHFDVPVFSRPSDPEIERTGQVHEGVVSTALGLRGIPAAAEDIAVARDLSLSELTGGRVHLTGVSTQGAVRQIREAKSRGVRVTADVSPLHLLMTQEAMYDFPVNLKLRPPLRELSDRQALVDGLIDGTIDAIASHHRPQSVLEKDAPFEAAAFGSIGLQTAVSLGLALIEEAKLPKKRWVASLSNAPARVLGLPSGLKVGTPANLAILDPSEVWNFDHQTNRSKSCASVHFGDALRGRVHWTMVSGRLVFQNGQEAQS